jgi:predicted phage terminase large subunit-like protein
MRTRAFSPQAILIEDRASGTQLIQELIAAGCWRATRFSPGGDKIMRLFAQTATIETGFVWLPDEAPWLAGYLAAFAAFPRGRHDDQVDSTASSYRHRLAPTALAAENTNMEKILLGD